MAVEGHEVAAQRAAAAPLPDDEVHDHEHEAREARDDHEGEAHLLLLTADGRIHLLCGMEEM